MNYKKKNQSLRAERRKKMTNVLCILSSVLLVVITGILMLTSFKIGVIFSQKKEKNEKIEFKSPLKAISDSIEEHKENKKLKKQEEIDAINAYNIEHYNGTGLGQKDFPS